MLPPLTPLHPFDIAYVISKKTFLIDTYLPTIMSTPLIWALLRHQKHLDTLEYYYLEQTPTDRSVKMHLNTDIQHIREACKMWIEYNELRRVELE